MQQARSVPTSHAEEVRGMEDQKDDWVKTAGGRADEKKEKGERSVITCCKGIHFQFFTLIL